MAMSGHRELHLRVQGIDHLQVNGKPSEPLDVYCIAWYGHVRHRTRLLEDTLSPNWNEEFVFDAALFEDSAVTTTYPVVTFEIFSQGLFRDELLCCAYLDLELSGLLDTLNQQQQQQQQWAAAATVHRGSATGSPGDPTSAADGATAVSASANGFSRLPDSSGTCKLPQTAAQDPPAAAAAAVSCSEMCYTKGLQCIACPGFSTEVQQHSLALLAAQPGSSSSSGGSGGGSGATSSRARKIRRSGNVDHRQLGAAHLKRSSHVSSHGDGGELEVAVWWVQQPSLGNTGTPPRIISFVHPPNTPHPLPSATHTTTSSQWEEPALAFLRIVVKGVDLGPAAAAVGGSSSSSSGGVQRSKAVLRNLKGLLTADVGVDDGDDDDGGSVDHGHKVDHDGDRDRRSDDGGKQKQKQQLKKHQKQQQQQQQSRNAGGSGVLQRQNATRHSAAATTTAAGVSALYVLESIALSDSDDDSTASNLDDVAFWQAAQCKAETRDMPLAAAAAAVAAAAAATAAAAPTAAAAGDGDGVRSRWQQSPKKMGQERLMGVFRRSSEDGGLTGDEATTACSTANVTDEESQKVSPVGSEGGTSAPRQQQQQNLAKVSKRAQKKAIRRQLDQQLYLTVKIQLGQHGKQKTLRPVQLAADGSAEVVQSAVFAVARPLQDEAIHYQLILGLGPRGLPLLGVGFQYKMLHLLRRSPERPLQWQQWRDVAKCSASGLQIPLPCLPESFLDTSAFLADSDCRAGMYMLPPVAAKALAAAARDDAEAAAAVATFAAVAPQTAAQQNELPGEGFEPGLKGVSFGEQQPELLSPADSLASGMPSTYAGSGSSDCSSAAAAAGGGGVKGVLRRRVSPASGKQQQQQQMLLKKKGEAAAEMLVAAARGKGLSHLQEKLKDRAAARVGKVLVRVEEGFHQALDKLPPGMAQQVKESSFIKRVFPGARRSEVFSLGQLRVPTFRHPTAAAAAGAGYGSPHAPQPTEHNNNSGSSSSSNESQQCSDVAEALEARSNGDLGAKQDAPAAAAAAGWSLGQHPNVAPAGCPATRPLGILILTLQAISLRSSSSSSSSTSSIQLLLRCGPHWLQLQQAALPITFYNPNSSSSGGAGGSSSSGGGAGGPGVVDASFTSTAGAAAAAGAGASAGGSSVAPVQVLVPVFGSSSLVTLVIHKRGSVIGRCVFKLYGLLPLLLREHTKTLTLYSDKRGAGGQRIICGSILARLAASPPAGYSKLTACIRLAYSYLITPHTLEMHTSGVLGSIGCDERDDAVGELVVEWLASAGQQGKQAVPENLVNQLVSTGRGRVSGSRMRGHVRRIKAVLLDWLPRRLDPLAFYYWKHPLQNLFVLWCISHACLHPAKWLFAVSLLVTLTLIRRMAIQIHRGVLGFELEQLPPDMAAAAGLPDHQQQQQQHQSRSGVTSPDDDLDSVMGDLQGSKAPGVQLGERLRYKEAAERFRARLANVANPGKKQVPPLSPTGGVPPASSFPKTPRELREQLDRGTLNLDNLDIEELAQQLLSVGGLLRLARQHSRSFWDYALVMQNMLDDAAGFTEGLYAMLTAQDPLAAVIFCCIIMSATTFCFFFGLGAGIFVIICVLLRPPLLRGVPGVFGWKALLANLPNRSFEELSW